MTVHHCLKWQSYKKKSRREKKWRGGGSEIRKWKSGSAPAVIIQALKVSDIITDDHLALEGYLQVSVETLTLKWSRDSSHCSTAALSCMICAVTGVWSNSCGQVTDNCLDLTQQSSISFKGSSASLSTPISVSYVQGLVTGVCSTSDKIQHAFFELTKALTSGSYLTMKHW